MRRLYMGVIAGFVLLGLGLFSPSLMGQAGGNAAAKNMKNPVKATSDSIAAGQKIFARSCVVCHGMAGKGDGTIVASLEADASCCRRRS